MIDTDEYKSKLTSSFSTIILRKSGLELLAEVERLREAFVIAVRHVGYHHSQDCLFGVLSRLGWNDLFDLDEDFGEWEE